MPPHSELATPTSPIIHADFGLKPAISPVFNNPDLKVGAIDVAVNKRFSLTAYFFHTFLKQTH